MAIGFSISLMLVAFVVTSLVYPYVLSFARKHSIVDNPNTRKLQRVPVPVMGGTTVFIGIVVAVVFGYCLAPMPRVITTLTLLLVMYLIGVWDDAKDVSAYLRFAVEVLVVWMMIVLLKVEINDFHGLWGVHQIPDAISVPLSLIAGVGIINAINLIDGVDGYCSSFGVISCIVFAVIFYYAGDMSMFTLALIAIGALVPFFFHNVFGKTSKMFLGDGGSLMLGTLLALFMFSALSSNSPYAEYSDRGISLPALILAILAVPVFDTLKVMIFRVAKGQSPFHPDKTHLHHLFIAMDFSHLGTSAIIVSYNLLIVLVLALVWYLGAGVDLQLYIVIAMSVLFTCVFYFYMEHERRKNDGAGSDRFRRWCRRGVKTDLSGGPVWKFISRFVDSRFFGGKPVEFGNSSSQNGGRIDPRIK